MSNDFSAGTKCKALWRFESGALKADSKSTNTWVTYNADPTEDTSVYQEGACSALFTRASSQALTITDANLASGFPLKSGETNRIFTLCFWVRWTTIQGASIFCKSLYGTTVGFDVQTTGGKFRVIWGYGTATGQSYWDVFTPVINNWYHIAIRICGSGTRYRSVRVYDSNAGYAVTYNISAPTSDLGIVTRDLFLGCGDGGGSYSDLRFDEMIMFDTLLTEREIDNIRASSFPPAGNDFSGSSDCVAAYNFESGALSTDSKNGNTLTLVNSPTENTDTFKQGSCCMSLAAGTTQYASITDANLPSGWPLKSDDTSKLISVSCWIRPTTVDANKRRIISKWRNTGNLRSFQIYYNNSRIYMQYSINGTSGVEVAITGGPVNAYHWFHLVLVVDGKNKTWWSRVYNSYASNIDGEGYYSGTLTGELNIAAADFRIGADDDLAANTNFNGQIDEVVIFNSLLERFEASSIKEGVYPVTESFWHVDPKYGADGKSGTSWTEAWKTIEHSIWIGDDIKVAKSEETTAAGTVTATTGSLTVSTTNDLTTVCPATRIIRISNDDTLYMVKSITAAAITLYRPYRGTTGSGKSLTYYGGLPISLDSEWTPTTMTGTDADHITLTGGVNTSDNSQDGFTILYGAHANVALGGTWNYVDISRLAMDYWVYPWNAILNYCTITNCFQFICDNTGSGTGIWNASEVDGFVSEQTVFPLNLHLRYTIINNLETAHSTDSGMKYVSAVYYSDTVFKNWKNAGYVTANKAAIEFAGGSYLRDIRIIDSIFDERKSGCMNMYMPLSTPLQNFIIQNPTVGSGTLFSLASGYVLSGDIQLSNINGYMINKTIQGMWQGAAWSLVESDMTTSRSNVPSVKVTLHGLYWSKIRHYVPCDTDAQTTISAWVMKNSNPISTFTINTAGSGYVVGDQFLVVQAGGGSAILQVATLSGSGVATATLISGGYNYSVANDLATTTLTGAGSGCKINITALGSGYGSSTLPYMRLRWMTGTSPALVSNEHIETMTDVNNTWQQLSYTITPSITAAVVVEFVFQSAVDGAIGWYDDLSVEVA